VSLSSGLCSPGMFLLTTSVNKTSNISVFSKEFYEPFSLLVMVVTSAYVVVVCIGVHAGTVTC
jgi:hypothetical protein